MKEKENWERTKRLSLARHKKEIVLRKIDKIKNIVPKMNSKSIEKKNM